MLSFSYTARDPNTGQKVNSEVQANSEQEAAKIIIGEGLAPLDIKPIGASNSGPSRFRNRISTKQKIVFSRQMSTLINAGLPLVQSLRNVADQTENKTFKLVINKVTFDSVI